jgi:hypothetical protein
VTVRGEENVMNRKDVNWLLETLKDPDDAERFVMAQCEHGRISLQTVADVARERGWINRTVNPFPTVAPHHSIAYATAGLTVAVP